MASLTLFATTACVTPPPAPTTPPQASATPEPSAQPGDGNGTETEPAAGGDQAERAAALQAYVDAEVATIPQIEEQFPGVYDEIAIDGAIESSTGDGDVPAGDYAVMRYGYTYAGTMDWEATIAGLDGQRSALDEACATQVFPAISAAGVEGPLAAVYSYRDSATTGSEPMWSHTCTSD